MENPIYRNRSFWNNFAEHFGTFKKYTLLPYTSSDMASLHNIDHLDCVNKLILALKPLSDSVNQFVKDNYKNLYMKLSKLSWNPFTPRPFGVFLMIAINFNILSDFHWDNSDKANCFCV